MGEPNNVLNVCLMKRTRSRKKYEAFIMENQEYFSRIPKSAVDVIDVCTSIKNIRKYLQFKSNGEGEEEADMCKALNEIERYAEKQGLKKGIKQGISQGITKGISQGISQGITQGESRFASLMEKLFADDRMEEAKLAVADETARKLFYQEYGIA